MTESGLLETEPGTFIHWESTGPADGRTMLFLHGGPGSGTSGGYRRHLDTTCDRAVSLDQRGCGRSRPLATDDLGSLAGNTTQALIRDIEAIREHLGIERWLVVGGSWGTTLALAYALAHPSRVTGLVLAAVTTTSRAEVDWVTESMGAVFPREWDAFAAASGRRPGQRVVEAYRERLTDADPAVRANAARAWCAWEDVHVSLAPGSAPDPRYDDPAFRELFATLVTHYWAADGFAGPTELIDRVGEIAHLPAVLIHGRLDVSSPLATAWRLHRSWPGSRLVVVDDEGHGGSTMAEHVTTAVDSLLV